MTDPMQDLRGSIVWLGMWHPAPDNPPRRETVEHVFASEKAAQDWADEYNRLPSKLTGAWRWVERREVVDHV